MIVERGGSLEGWKGMVGVEVKGRVGSPAKEREGLLVEGSGELPCLYFETQGKSLARFDSHCEPPVPLGLGVGLEVV